MLYRYPAVPSLGGGSMDGETRRAQIIELLKDSRKPLSGTELAKRFLVSRQVIVQDIALLRAVNKNILSTNKGYILYDAHTVERNYKRTVHVKHSNDQIRDELYTIVDYGGKILDVVVEHEIYGQITVDLIISNRQDADEFVKRLSENQTRPLNELTYGVHYHTIVAEKEEYLDRIEQKLGEKGYLVLDKKEKS